MTSVGKARAFKVAFPEKDLEKLQARLNDAELPEEDIVPGSQWDYGSNLAKLSQLVNDWKHGNPRGSDGQPTSSSSSSSSSPGVASWWRGVESKMNKYPHYMVEIEKVQLHYQIAMSKDENAIPLIFSHGWPGSFYEAHFLIDELVQTDRDGPSFHVVVPSLVGYGFSGPPPRRGWTLQDTARLFDALMTKVLPFKTGYLAHGGDWGHVVTRYLSFHPSCKALHTNFHVPNFPLYALPSMALVKMGYRGMVTKLLSYFYDEFELRGIQRGMDYISKGNAYYLINSTTPATIGYGMYQSPVAILSYLLDKFEQWTDPRSPAFQPPGQGIQSSKMTDETILINTTIYYLSKTIHTSFLPYYESTNAFDQLKESKVNQAGSKKPFGYSAFPYELAAGPKAWVSRLNVNFVYYKRHSVGGHFAALEAPRELADDLREFAAAHWKA